MYHFVNRRGDEKMLIPFYTEDPVVTRTFGERNTIEDLGFLAAPIPTGALKIENNKKADHGYGRDQVLMFFRGKSIVWPMANRHR